jgi:DNA polymerase III epsilon subunit-like protein
MKKIDKRKKYFMVLDTETAPIDREIQEVTPNNMLVYDIGFCIVDKKGVVYYKGSYLVSEIFCGEFYSKMQSSYYAVKLPNYMQEIARGERVVKTWKQISFILRKVIEDYNISTIVAHNARFDFGAINNTKKYLEEYSLLPYLEWWDTLKMARSVLGEMPTYKKFCQDNGYLTKNGKCRFTAEIIYRYIIKDNDFVENHTGLEDTLIEKEILRYCFKQHKKMDKLLFNK